MTTEIIRVPLGWVDLGRTPTTGDMDRWCQEGVKIAERYLATMCPYCNDSGTVEAETPPELADIGATMAQWCACEEGERAYDAYEQTMIDKEEKE